MDIAGRRYGPPLPMRYDDDNVDDDVFFSQFYQAVVSNTDVKSFTLF